VSVAGPVPARNSVSIGRALANACPKQPAPGASAPEDSSGATPMPKPAFDHCAEEYARHRPPYPTGVFDTLNRETAARPGRLAADVGAGTGIFSRSLAAAGWRVVALEPSLPMLGRVDPGGRRRTPSGAVLPLCAAAEATALADQSVDLLAAAQAFHWFNPPYALAEFARVLRPGGLLALTWNNRDTGRSVFLAEYESLIARYNPAYRCEYRQQDWAGKIAASGGFEPAARHRFDHTWTPSQDGFVGFCRSVSYIRNVLARRELGRFENNLRGLMQAHFGTTDCVVPLRTDLWTARRRRH